VGWLDGGLCGKGGEGLVVILGGEGKRRERKAGGKRGEGVIIKRE